MTPEADARRDIKGLIELVHLNLFVRDLHDSRFDFLRPPAGSRCQSHSPLAEQREERWQPMPEWTGTAGTGVAAKAVSIAAGAADGGAEVGCVRGQDGAAPRSSQRNG